MPAELERKTASANPDRLDRIEERLARIERQLGLEEMRTTVGAPPQLLAPVEVGPAGDAFEAEVGQRWFAAAGIATLTLGLAFLLSLPYPNLPAAAPAMAGFALGAALLGVARAGARAFPFVAQCVRGAAMGLWFFATLRLFFFGAQPALAIDSLAGRALLAAVVALNLGISWRKRSRSLVGFAVVLGYAAAVIAGAAEFVLPMITALALAGAAAQLRAGWRALSLVAIVAGFATYLVWAMGNPIRGGAYHFVSGPAVAPWTALGIVAVLGATAVAWARRAGEDALGNLTAFFNCALGYGVILLHTAAAFPATFVVTNVAASLAFLSLAVAFWGWTQSRVATFFYAMTGYGALSMAILKAAPVPEVFVWLSLQSVLVVVTAVWFKSRFIVVANFFIYVAIVAGYVLMAERESGISLGFGLVAVGSARILNWQKGRLELKTELMRNAYLVSALLVFPYALHHLVPRTFVALAWVGLAAVYYGISLVMRSAKYRWMGHATLLFTMIYAVAIGTRQFEPVYRVLSFLALGAMLLIVSLTFTRARRGNAEKAPPA